MSQYDKTYYKTCATSDKDCVSAQPDQSSLIRCLLQYSGYPKSDKLELLPYWVGVQADLSIGWSHRP